MTLPDTSVVPAVWSRIVLSAGSYGNVARIIPPLVTTAEEVDIALSTIEESLRAASA